MTPRYVFGTMAIGASAFCFAMALHLIINGG